MTARITIEHHHWAWNFVPVAFIGLLAFTVHKLHVNTESKQIDESSMRTYITNATHCKSLALDHLDDGKISGYDYKEMWHCAKDVREKLQIKELRKSL